MAAKVEGGWGASVGGAIGNGLIGAALRVDTVGNHPGDVNFTAAAGGRAVSLKVNPGDGQCRAFEAAVVW